MKIATQLKQLLISWFFVTSISLHAFICQITVLEHRTTHQKIYLCGDFHNSSPALNDPQIKALLEEIEKKKHSVAVLVEDMSHYTGSHQASKKRSALFKKDARINNENLVINALYEPLKKKRIAVTNVEFRLYLQEEPCPECDLPFIEEIDRIAKEMRSWQAPSIIKNWYKELIKDVLKDKNQETISPLIDARILNYILNNGKTKHIIVAAGAYHTINVKNLLTEIGYDIKADYGYMHEPTSEKHCAIFEEYDDLLMQCSTIKNLKKLNKKYHKKRCIIRWIRPGIIKKLFQ